MKRVAALVALLSLRALAAPAEDDSVKAAQEQQLEDLRGEVADQIQLQAYDLLDELVYGWTKDPVFPTDTPVVLADVTVPVGFNSGLQALIENHFVALVVKNPQTHVVLAHCPECMDLVVHSGAKGTIVSRGVDQPEALAGVGKVSGAHHALFLDFEAEGSSLVLRVRMTGLEPALPIKYAKTLSSATSAPSLLRSPDKLKSAEEARREYLDAIEGRGLLFVPVRLGIRTYQVNPNAQVAVPPFVWLEAGVEMAFTQARAWTGNLMAGFSWTPQLHIAWMLQARVSRLLSGSTSSLTHPDLYAFVGAGIISTYGRDALLFRPNIPTPEDILAASGNNPTSVIGMWHVGLELRVKNRISVIGFMESAPGLNGNPNIGTFIDFGIVKVQTLGFEVSFCF